jgi:hypothetical protein
MNNEYTDISVVQDKSGSMSSVRTETIQGFNGFLEEQKKAPGKCTFTLMQFDTSFNMLYSGEDIQKVQPLTPQTYEPSGYTALLDAIGRTILTTGQRLDALPEDQKPARVIVAILTDGEENSSREFGGAEGRAKIFEMIKHQTERYNWQFVFLGANQDSIQAGAGIGVAASNSISTANNAKGVTAAYESLSRNTRSYRASAPSDVQKMSFCAADRDVQYAAGAMHDSMAGKNQPDDKDTVAKA